MQGIVKRTNKGEEAYYFDLYLYSGNSKKGISRFLGREMPDRQELAEKLFEYYEDFSKVVIGETGKKVKDYFKYTGVDDIERSRFYYWALKHELNKNKLDRFQIIFSILFILNSARAEGSRMVREDVEKSMDFRKKAKSNEQREAQNALRALTWAFSKDFTWSTLSIRKLHGILFEGLEPELAGKYKPYDNIAGDSLYGEITTTTSYKKVPEAMKALFEEVKRNKSRIYPPILALESHLKFEAIHPFHDGNGRIGRILLNRLLVENGFMPVIFFEENHKAYCNSLGKAREGQKDKYIKLFVKQLKKTRKVIEEHFETKEFQSQRKNLSVLWDYSKKQYRISFTNLANKFRS